MASSCPPPVPKLGRAAGSSCCCGRRRSQVHAPSRQVKSLARLQSSRKTKQRLQSCQHDWLRTSADLERERCRIESGQELTLPVEVAEELSLADADRGE